MPQEVCMDAMPDKRPRSQIRMLRISSHSSLHGSTLGIPDLPPNLDATIMIANMADPPFNFDGLGTFPFYLKIVQLFLAVVCSGLYSDSIIARNTSTADQLLPYIVFTVFMIINTVTILSFVLGQRMPELSMRIFAILGCILFAAASVGSMRVWRMYDESDVGELDEKNKARWKRAPHLLLTEALLAFSNSILFFTEACHSYYSARVTYETN